MSALPGGNLALIAAIASVLVVASVASPNGASAQETCVSPPSGLVSWWPGDGDATDIAGGTDGTLEDGASFGDAMVGQGFSFGGGTQRVFVEDSPALTITESLTLDAWVKLTAYPADVGIVIFRGDDRSALDPYTLRVVGTNMRMQIEDGSGAFDFVEAPIGLNEFVHVAGTLDDATGRLALYLDGTMASEKTTTIRPFGVLTGANPGVSIGNVQSNIVSEGFVGQIDEVEIFGRALPDAAIESIADSGRAGKCKPGPQVSSLRSDMVRAVPDPLEISTEPDVIGTNAGLALFGVALVLLSAQLFNSAVKENEHEIERFGRPFVKVLLLPFRAVRELWRRVFAGYPRYSRILGIGIILVATALIYGYLEPEFSLDEKGILLVFGLMVGLGVVTYVYNGTEGRVTERWLGVPAGVRVYPAALAIAVVCVLFTRALSFQPGVVYGFVAATAVLGSRTLGPGQQGKAVAIAAAALISVFLVSWFLMIPFREWADSDDNWVSVTLEASAAIVVVAALETLAFSMVPLEFQDGAKVWSYNRIVFFVLAITAGFLYLTVVLSQEEAGFEALGGTGTLAAGAVLATYVGLTVAVWGFFFLKHRRARAGGP